MPVSFHAKIKTFHLYNDNISYIFTVLRNGHLGHLYYGKRVHDRQDFGHLLELHSRSMSACYFPGDLSFSLEHIKQEYPSYGSGDMRYPAYEIEQKNGSTLSELKYQSYNIMRGKPVLEALPATYTERDEEAETLEVFLKDELLDVTVVLSYTVFKDYAAIARNARFVNKGTQSVVLTHAMSFSVDFPDANFEMIELTGAWARERHVKTRKLEHGIQAIYSMRGCSSANYNPFTALKRPETTEYSGEAYGFSLVYSGNFLAQTEVDTYNTTRVTMGIHPQNFRWTLHPGDRFQTPEAVSVYSNSGLNGMSQTYHGLYRSRLAKGEWRDKTRPILINNWEGTYFDFDEEKILSIARAGKALDLELFVLDDGWFGKRDDDTSSLGDWFPYEKKLPNGIKGLAKKIVDMGMLFGLWFEPEMVNIESELYRQHPEWTLRTPGRNCSHGRHQYVLDFSKNEVVDYIYDRMENILHEAPVSYIKWDMNRSISESFSSGMPSEYQGTVLHRYILGVYRLYRRLTERFPHILFESCASGGSRFDPGMLHYAPQCWTSDNSDAVERQKIQYGTSFVYPVSSMGSHVTASPNHQMGRSTPLDTRANVAYFGTFGYELDLNHLTEEEKAAIKEQVAFMKEYRQLIQYGTFYRLVSPFEGNATETAWMVVSDNKKEALVGYYRALERSNNAYRRIRLDGLDESLLYHVSIHDIAQYGDELMNIGLSVSDQSSGYSPAYGSGQSGDYQSRIYILKAE